MKLPYLDAPLFWVGDNYVSLAGLCAFAIFFALALTLARVLQSDFVRRILSRLRMDKNLVAIVTTIMSLAALVFFTITGVNAAGIPLSWIAPVPGVSISLLQIFLLIALLIAVVWISSW